MKTRQSKLHIIVVCLFIASFGINPICAQNNILKNTTNPDRWNMFGPARLQIQDFTITDKYTDTANGKLNGTLLDKASIGLGVGFFQQYSKKIAISAEFQFAYGFLSRTSPSADDQQRAWSESIRSDVYYFFYKPEMPLQPYLFSGLLGTHKMGKVSLTVPVGFGARYVFGKQASMITTQVGYGMGVTGGIRNSLLYSFGFYTNLKKLNK